MTFSRRALCLAGLLASSLSSFAAPSKTVEINVLARVAGRVVTDRQVLLDALLESPAVYFAHMKPRDLPKDIFDRSLQRVVVQVMILEENRLVGREKNDEQAVTAALVKFKRTIGSNLKAFQTQFELTDADLRDRISQKALVNRILEARVRTVITDGEAGTAREESARRAIDDWLKQLRSRYRVQYLKVLGSGA